MAIELLAEPPATVDSSASEAAQAGVSEVAPVEGDVEIEQSETVQGSDGVAEMSPDHVDEPKDVHDFTEEAETFEGKPLKQLFPEERKGWSG